MSSTTINAASSAANSQLQWVNQEINRARSSRLPVRLLLQAAVDGPNAQQLHTALVRALTASNCHSTRKMKFYGGTGDRDEAGGIHGPVCFFLSKNTLSDEVNALLIRRFAITFNKKHKAWGSVTFLCSKPVAMLPLHQRADHQPRSQVMHVGAGVAFACLCVHVSMFFFQVRDSPAVCDLEAVPEAMPDSGAAAGSACPGAQVLSPHARSSSNERCKTTEISAERKSPFMIYAQSRLSVLEKTMPAADNRSLLAICHAAWTAMSLPERRASVQSVLRVAESTSELEAQLEINHVPETAATRPPHRQQQSRRFKTPFMVYCRSALKVLQQATPSANIFTLMSTCSRDWKDMSLEEQRPFELQAWEETHQQPHAEEREEPGPCSLPAMYVDALQKDMVSVMQTGDFSTDHRSRAAHWSALSAQEQQLYFIKAIQDAKLRVLSRKTTLVEPLAIYIQSALHGLEEAYPGASFPTLCSFMYRAWKAMSAEEQQPYYEQALHRVLQQGV